MRLSGTAAEEVGPRGPAIVLVPETSGPVEASTDGDANLTPVDVQDSVHTLVTGSGGTVDADVSLELSQRPATVTLTVEGRARDLDATVRTSEGSAFRQANGTWPANATEGLTRVHPGNLTDGTYRISVHADRLDGQLALTARRLDVANRTDPLEAPDAALDRLGDLVAEVDEGGVWQVATHGTGTLTLAVDQTTWANVHVYNDGDQLVRRVDVGQRGPSWQFGSNASQGPAYQALRLDVPDGTYTIHADEIGDENATVYALVPGDGDTPSGRSLDVETRIVEVPYPTTPSGQTTKTVRYPGGLLDISVAGSEGAATDRRVTVDSPVGIVLRQSDQAAANGETAASDSETYLDRFGSGPLDVRLETESGVGALHLEIEHYIP